MIRQAIPLGPAELDRLEQLLASEIFYEKAMPLDMLQGLFCAVASAPDLIPPGKWMNAALGENPAYETPEQAREVFDLLMRFYNQTVSELNEGQGVTLFVFPNEQGEDDLGTWCEGYLEGLQLSEVDWYEHGEEEEVEDLLFPFMLLSGRMLEYAEEAGNRLPTPEEERELVRAAAKSLGDSVLAIHSYWLDKRVSH